jgi:cardiolipin synthase
MGGDNRRQPTDIRALTDQADSRAAGAPLIVGNSVRLLQDARENYPAWLEAIGQLKHADMQVIAEAKDRSQCAPRLCSRLR